MQKKRIFTEALKTIKDNLSEFDFLEHSTRKRNLAYQLQYLDFNMQLLREYNLYGAIEAAILRHLVIHITNIIEYLLFVSLSKVYDKDPKNHKLPSLIGQAKNKGLIDKTLASNLNGVVEIRNKLHPSKQNEELDIKCFTYKEVHLCLLSMHNLRDQLRNFFSTKNVKVETNIVECPYEGQIGWDWCYYCGEFHW